MGHYWPEQSKFNKTFEKFFEDCALIEGSWESQRGAFAKKRKRWNWKRVIFDWCTDCTGRRLVANWKSQSISCIIEIIERIWRSRFSEVGRYCQGSQVPSNSRMTSSYEKVTLNHFKSSLISTLAKVPHTHTVTQMAKIGIGRRKKVLVKT